MSVRPRGVAVLSWIFIAVGCMSFAAHALPLFAAWTSRQAGESLGPLVTEHAVGLASGLLAIAAGAYMLAARNWARWLAIAWMGFHVVLSLGHSSFELLVHALMFAAIVGVLLQRHVSAYFNAARIA